MFNECLDVFSHVLEENTEKWLLDEYVPTAGTYVLINIDDNFSLLDSSSIIDIKINKKNQEVDVSDKKNYDLIRFLDKNSKLLTMNKAIDSSKIIHSNNYYSLYVKKESIKDKKLGEKNINIYYDILTAPETKYKKAKAKQLYNIVNEQCGVIETLVIENIRNWVSTNLYDFITSNNIDVNSKDYLKIFFVYKDEEKTKDVVLREGKRYFLTNIYNNNDYNAQKDDIIYGLHNNNMGLNDKKPFLENKSRKWTVPVLVTLDRALLQYKFMEYLSAQAAKGRYNIYFDFDKKNIYCLSDNESLNEIIISGMYLRIIQGKTEVEIHAFEKIVDYNPNLDKKFVLNEYIELNEKYRSENEKYYIKYNKLYEIEKLINSIFFNKYLKSNYRTKPADMPTISPYLKELILNYRECMWMWFYSSDDNIAKSCIDKLAKKAIVNNLENSEKVKNQFNLWFSLQAYFFDRRNGEKMKDIRECFKEHILMKEEWMLSGDDEYYYAVGQLSRYLVNLNKSNKKNLDMIKPVINVKNDDKLKERLKELLKKYDYAIDIGFVRLGILIANILTYQPQNKVNDVMILAGFVDNNHLYISSKKNNDNSDN